MVKQVLCLMTLVAGLIPFLGGSLAAQEMPKPALSDYFQVPPSQGVMTPDFPKPQNKPARPPSYCQPCLFYGGDLDPSSAKANGLWNADSGAIKVDGEVLVPFTIPRGQQWLVTGLFTNILSDADDVQKATWSISKGVTTGSGGHTIASGTAHATYRPTGRSDFGLTEYTTLVNTPVLLLGTGTYWLTVVPLCAVGSPCGSGVFYESDSPDNPPLNSYGPLEPNDMSYFNSASFGYTYALVGGASEACSGIGCDRFSAGVQGYGL